MEVKIDKQMFSDKEILEDCLCSEKFLVNNYNFAATESSTLKVRDELNNLLSVEHQLLFDVFTQMSNRGYYPTTTVEKNQILTTKQKYIQKS